VVGLGELTPIACGMPLVYKTLTLRFEALRKGARGGWTGERVDVRQ